MPRRIGVRTPLAFAAKTVMLGALMLCRGLPAQQTVQAEVPTNAMEATTLSVQASISTSSVNDSELPNTSPSWYRQAKLERRSTPNSASGIQLRSMSLHGDAPSQVSTQGRIVSGSIQSKGSTRDFASSQKSTAQESGGNPGNRKFIPVFAVAASGLRSNSLRSAVLNEMAISSRRTAIKQHVDLGSTAIAPWVNHYSVNYPRDQDAIAGSGNGATLGTDHGRRARDGHQGPLHELNQRQAGKGLRHNSRFPGAASVR